MWLVSCTTRSNNPGGYCSVFAESDGDEEHNLVDGITVGQADRIWKRVARRGKHRASRAQAWLCHVGLYAFAWVTWNRYRCIGKRRVRWIQGVRRTAVGVAVAFLLLFLVGLVLCWAFRVCLWLWQSVFGLS